MTVPSLESLVRLAGVVHLLVAAASLAVPRELEWGRRLAVLDEFHRRLFWVYAGFTLFVNVGFGALSILAAPELASGGGLARLVCGFIGLYWLLRLGVQFAVFDHRAVVTGPLARLGYHALTAAFVFFVVVFAVTAFAQPG